MSDMSRPGPLPTAPDHELHDPLLVAQFTAGDQLDPDQQRLAEQMVSTCGACAALANDLRAVSGAVAWEPMPPRRRDFRISPEQAEELRGNPFTRFMRRLTLPQTRVLRPAAAGVMSLGLLLVVAGNAWPGDEFVIDTVVPAEAPAAIIEERVATTAAPLAESAAEAVGARSEAAAPELDAVGASESLDDSLEQAGAEDRAAQKSLAETRDENAFDDVLGGAAAPEANGLAAPEALEVDRDAAIQFATEPDASILPGSESSGVGVIEVERDGGDGAADLPAEPEGAAADLAVGSTVAVDDGLSVEDVLVVVGLVLTLGGGIALLLVLVSRRAADPLLR